MKEHIRELWYESVLPFLWSLGMWILVILCIGVFIWNILVPYDAVQQI